MRMDDGQVVVTGCRRAYEGSEGIVEDSSEAGRRNNKRAGLIGNQKIENVFGGSGWLAS